MWTRLVAPFLPYILAILIGGGLVIGIYKTGWNAAWREADVLGKQQQINTLKSDLKIAQDAAASATRRQTEIEMENTANEISLQSLRDYIKDNPVKRAPINDAEAQRLRNIK